VHQRSGGRLELDHLFLTAYGTQLHGHAELRPELEVPGIAPQRLDGARAVDDRVLGRIVRMAKIVSAGASMVRSTETAAVVVGHGQRTNAHPGSRVYRVQHTTRDVARPPSLEDHANRQLVRARPTFVACRQPTSTTRPAMRVQPR